MTKTGIKSRKTSDSDASQIAAWIAADPSHAGTTEASFFLPSENTSPSTFFHAIEDEKGPIFFVRAETGLRLHVQSAPSEHQRTTQALAEFAEMMGQGAKKLGYAELIFESVRRPLINFLHRHGFRASTTEHIMDLRTEEKAS